VSKIDINRALELAATSVSFDNEAADFLIELRKSVVALLDKYERGEASADDLYRFLAIIRDDIEDLARRS